MPVDVVMPRLSDSMVEGKVNKWLKKEGDHINKGEPVAEIETDKANMELESFDTGTVTKIMVPEGQTVPVGQPIALIETQEKGRVAAATPAPPAAAPAPPPPPSAAPTTARIGEKEPARVSPLARRIAEEHGVDLAQVKGTGPDGRIVREDVENFLKQVPPVAPTAEAPPALAVSPLEGIEVMQLPKMGLTIAERMTRLVT
ncbi:MAG: E3 binding domain-containing protein, partial [Chloroflexi bacterium]|nr:E3 binding domain-containing protein [Chloroflexota bacterium]